MKTIAYALAVLSFFALTFAACIGSAMLSLPPQCHDVRANLTKYTPECRASIIRERARHMEGL